MKTTLFNMRAILLAMLLLPGMIIAQPFNDIYRFRTAYERSVHTCGYQITNTDIIEGGTIDNPAISAIEKVVELGRVTPAGVMIPSPFYYFLQGKHHRAVDLIESSVTPDWVVVAANLNDPATGSDNVNIFKADPVAGTVAWSVQFGTLPGRHYASAITRDNAGNYYVLGYTFNSAGNRILYMISITDGGATNWERYYYPPSAGDEIVGVDLVWDPAVGAAIITGDYYAGAPAGVFIAQVGPGGGIGPVRHIVSLANMYKDFQVRDIDVVNGNYVLVGNLNTVPQQGWMVQYTPGLLPFAPFGSIYTAGGAVGLTLTGVKPNAGIPNIFISFDMTVGGAVNPGILEVTPLGAPVAPSPIQYAVPSYVQSNGLIGLNGLIDYAIKGNTFATPPGGPASLSLVADNTPLAVNPMICANPVAIDYYEEPQEQPIMFDEQDLHTSEEIDLPYEKVRGRMWDCFGAFLGNFKRSVVTGMEENESHLKMELFPNPSNGHFTLQLTEELAAQYELAEVYNTLGEVVMSFQVNKVVEQLDLSGQSKGIYLLRMKSSDGNVSEAKRMIIN